VLVTFNTESVASQIIKMLALTKRNAVHPASENSVTCLNGDRKVLGLAQTHPQQEISSRSKAAW